MAWHQRSIAGENENEIMKKSENKRQRRKAAISKSVSRENIIIINQHHNQISQIIAYQSGNESKHQSVAKGRKGRQWRVKDGGGRAASASRAKSGKRNININSKIAGRKSKEGVKKTSKRAKKARSHQMSVNDGDGMISASMKTSSAQCSSHGGIM